MSIKVSQSPQGSLQMAFFVRPTVQKPKGIQFTVKEENPHLVTRECLATFYNN